MFIVFSGWGLMALPLVAVTGLVVAFLFGLFLKTFGITDPLPFAGPVGILAGAAVNWIVGRRLNSRAPREMIDVRTQQRVNLYRRHSLFWIKMEYWSIPIALAAVVIPLVIWFQHH